MTQPDATGDSSAARSKLDYRLYAFERARGRTQFDALVAAGSDVSTPSAASGLAHKLEAREDVQRHLSDAREAIAVDHEETFEIGMAEVRRIIVSDTTSDNVKLRAVELVGRMLGRFMTKHELSGPSGGPIETSLSEDERAKWVAQAAQSLVAESEATA